MEKINKNYPSLIIWIFCLIFISMIIGNLTQSGIDVWYTTLNRSSLTPPNYLFPIVWSILYAIIATCGWLIWHSQYFVELRSIKILYVIHLFVNWSWTPLFFTFHLTGIALACLLLMIILVILIISKAYKELNTVTLLFIPYLLWLLFAMYLNFYIWQHN